jgi:hypothetical protein
MSGDTTINNAAPATRRSSLLWVSAFVLLALLLMQAQPLLAQLGGGGGGHAQGGMVSQVGPLTVLTADAGGDDVLLVLEGRSEELFVYRADRNGVQLQQRMAIPKLFQDARMMSGR